MKKYIKYYDEDSKKVKRLAATENITIATEFFTNRLDIRFINSITGQTRLTMSLHVIDKAMEEFCKAAISVHLSSSIEAEFRKIMTDKYEDFLGSPRQIFPFDKVHQNMVLMYNLFLQTLYNKGGKAIKDLSDNIEKSLH